MHSLIHPFSPFIYLLLESNNDLYHVPFCYCCCNLYPRWVLVSSCVCVGFIDSVNVGASAAPQLTTVLPLGVGTGGNGVISGVIVGSGPDGTTFVLTPAATGGATPETGTHLSSKLKPPFLIVPLQ